MATKIRLMRLGKIRAPYYRIVVADSRTKREGRVIETIGKYHPKEDPSYIDVNAARVAYWLGVGAQPTEPVEAILKITGDWQRFKGLPEPEPMKTATPRADKREVFAAAARDAAGVTRGEPTTARGGGGRRRGGQAEPAEESATAGAADRAAGADRAAPDTAEQAGTARAASEPVAGESGQHVGSGDVAGSGTAASAEQ
ncbi:MAG: 30S ribosomal protein S16 [Frankiaceae bacterium]